MDHEGSITHLQDPVTCSWSEPEESSTFHTILFLSD